MRIRPARILIIAGLIGSAAIGCYRSPNTTWYEPQVYKGSDDPLLERLKEGRLHTELEERFQSVQIDR